MDNQEHKSARCNFLPRGPGLLDSIYNVWCQASEAVLGPKATATDKTADASAPYKVAASWEHDYK